MSKMGDKDKKNPWLLAIRPKTLPAAAAPVIVGTALAFAHQNFQVVPALACLLVALLLQIGSNLANDVYDYEKGTDSGKRLGPTRVTQAGLLTPREVKGGMWGVFGLTAVIGLTLIFRGGWPILVLGLAAILSAIAYTGGPYPLGYHGLGDLFVFIFFGLAATAGTYYLQAGEITSVVWAMAAAMGFLTVDILVVNNLRDIDTDRQANKKTLAVRLGEKGAVGEYTLLMVAAFLIPVFLWIVKLAPFWGLLTWAAAPLAFHWAKFITHKRGAALNKALAGTGRLELIYATLFALGMILSVWAGSG